MARSPEFSRIALHQHDYSLRRDAERDKARHKEKVKEALLQNIGNVVSNPDILIPKKDGFVRVPMPQQLDEYRFRYDPNSQEQVGQGNGKSKVGDKIGGTPQPGEGFGAGNEPGEHALELWIPDKEFEDWMFEGWRLPFLQNDRGKQITSPSIRFTDVRKSGAFANLDKKRTILRNIKRNAMGGNPRFGGVKNDDLRFKTWEEVEDQQSQAVLLFMRDISGSMGDNEKKTSQVYFHLAQRFLKRNYEGVDIVFLGHDTEAQEVGEEEFFRMGSNGGTRISSAFELADKIIDERYSPRDWNIYPMYITDGDNVASDNPRSLQLVEQILNKANAFNVVEVSKTRPYPNTFYNVLNQSISNEHVISTQISGPAEAYQAANHFFTARD